MICALVLPLALFAGASAARPCDNGGIIWGVLNSRGLAFIPFPVGVPTPGGNTATGLYFDDRGQGNLGPIGSPLGYLAGDGTWIYLETNGVAGLQRGGHSSLPDSPLTGVNDFEFPACNVANPDELIF